MIEAKSLREVPPCSAVYALYDRKPPSHQPAYVGMGGNLRTRLVQHFIRRDSSVVTGASAAGLNIDLIRYVWWWSGDLLGDELVREAAELIAFDVFEPTLRSRGRVSKAARELYAEEGFRRQYKRLFEGPPSGRLALPSLSDLAQQTAILHERVAELAAQVERLLGRVRD